MLRRLPQTDDDNCLVSAATADDAGVYRIGPRSALVQTVDFFTPVVDDAYDFGQIAAANALSDVYAMGGRPITAMNLMGVPTDRVPPAAIARILRGGAAKAREAGCALVGGHTIRNPEPIYGLSVTGMVDPRRMMTNAAARAGDVLLLTKPLGTGVATTALKRGLASAGLVRKVTVSMKRLNVVGRDLARLGLVRAGTDVTGFGLLGHLASLCRASKVAAEVNAGAVPAFGAEIFALITQDCIPGGTRGNLATAAELVRWDVGVDDAHKVLLADAQTSGGLLLCVPPRRLGAVRKLLSRARTRAAEIGRITRASEPHIIVRA